MHRPARTAPSAPRIDEREVELPPTLPEDDGAGNILMLVPMLGAGASMTLMMLFRGSALAAVGALVMILTVIAFVLLYLSNRGRAIRRRRMLRDRYLTYLDREGSDLKDAERERVRLIRGADPHPGALLSLARMPSRLWERRRDDDDFLRLRIGMGEAHAAEFTRVGDDNAMSLDDEFMTGELDNLEQRYAKVPDAPVTLDVDSVGHVSIVGDLDFCRRIAMTLTAHAAALSSPEDVHMALTCPPGESRSHWSWMSWLPHLADQERTSDRGPIRRIAPDELKLAALLRPELHKRLTAAAQMRRNLRGPDVSRTLARMWIVSDHHGNDALDLPLGDREVTPSELGITMLHLLADREQEPDDISLRITANPEARGSVIVERYERRDQEPTRTIATLDSFTRTEAEALARYLASVRLSPDSLEHNEAQQALRAADMLAVNDLTDIDIDSAWAPRPRSSFLRVQIGTDDHGHPVMLDLKESAHYGMGPHGLAIGATGSGKSELLRTLVLGLCTGHGPEDVNLVLVDYKGGAAFAPFADLPHVAGVITNLGDDANLVERVYASLEGEVKRRQQLLKDAGNLADITSYRRKRAKSGDDEQMEALPHLVIIIDEFGELLTARPDFIDLFLSIGRIGRSIGVHLLLSSQRIESGKLRGLDTYLSYRIGLRTLSEAESRTVLETTDAFTLPPIPGYGYLKVDTTTYTRFRAGYVSGGLPDDDDDVVDDEGAGITLVEEYAQLDDDEAVSGAEDSTPGGSDDDDEPAETILSAVVGQLEDRPRVTRPIWLPPVPSALTLDQVAGAPLPTRRGLRLARAGLLSVPIGRLDDPGRQWQGTLNLQLAGPGGHVLVVGAPRSGKTTALHTIAASLSLTHGASEAVIYGLDLLGSGLLGVRGLPNVAGVATRQEREAIRRTIEEVHAAMHARESLLQRHGLPDLAAARSHPDPQWDAAEASEIVLMIDGFGQIGDEFMDLEDQVRDIVRRGAGLGVHVVATASRMNELRAAVQTYFGSRVELRLTEPGESAVGRKLSQTLSADRPGQCLMTGGLFGQIALPRIDGDADRSTAQQGLEHLVETATAGAVDRAPQVRLLPARVNAEMLDAPAQKGHIPIGLMERDLATAMLDINGADRNLLLIGDNGTGRSGTLAHVAQQLMAIHSPDDLVFAVFDPRRSLAGVIPDEYLGGYAPSAALAERLVAAILPELDKRVPATVGATVDAEPPTPRIVILADDYDVLTAGGTSPLVPLQRYLAMGPELNLSAMIARRSAGAARGLYEPLYNMVRESGATGLMFSGDRSEGMLLGSERPQQLPVGRARLVRSGQPATTIQVVAWEPADSSVEGVGFGHRK